MNSVYHFSQHQTPKGFRVSPRSTKEIRKVTQSIRSMFGFTQPKVPIVLMIDILTEQQFIELEILEDHHPLMADDLGNTQLIKIEEQKLPLIRLRNSVYEKATDGDGYSRFTVAHELGHAILHNSDLKLSRSITHRDKGLWYMDSEWQADTFAAELLMDLKHIKNGDTPYDISMRFGVSTQSASIRLSKLSKEGRV